MSIDPATLAFVYVAFQLKQWLADFALQPAWMARGKVQETGWLRPLLAHAAMHAAGTLVIVLVTASGLWFLAIADLAAHALIDKLKAEATRGWQPSEQRYWTAFGLDQMAHHLTHLGFLIAILTR